MAQTKATKKFERNHLKDTLKRRKESQKIKQKQQVKAKQKARKAEENRPADDVADGDKPAQSSKASARDNALASMSVDDFFQGGFDILQDSKKTSKKSSALQKEVAPKIGKRKRTEPKVAGDDTSAGEPVEENPVVDGSASEAESEDGIDDHKEQLDALAKKDPEFYKYLQENDAELLDFAEDADLAEIDALSGSEEEEAPKKKRKKDQKSRKAEAESDEDEAADNEVTKAMVKKWQTAMASQHSLRSMREAVLAFRTAAHINEEDGKEYKYSISNPDGKHGSHDTASYGIVDSV